MRVIERVNIIRRLCSAKPFHETVLTWMFNLSGPSPRSPEANIVTSRRDASAPRRFAFPHI